MSSIPATVRGRDSSWATPDKPNPGNRVCHVMADMLPCACQARVITTFVSFTSTVSAVPFKLDAAPVADGAFVVVESNFGGQAADEFDPALHAGWQRYAAHVCQGAQP